MKLKYVGRADAVRVDGITAERGVAVDVPDEVAAGLLGGDWSKVTTPKPAKGDDAEEAPE
jgi:hypothetical protein